MEPLGGFAAGCQDNSYLTLTTEALVAYADQYEATAILLDAEDPRIVDLSSLGWQTYEVGSVYAQEFVLATAK
jgi:hypothetical protein